MSEKQTDSDAQIAIAKITSKQAIVIAIITATSGLFGAALQANLGKPSSSTTSDAQVKELKVQVTELAQKLKSAKSLYRLTADQLERSLGETSNKGPNSKSPQELERIEYQRLNRAVFQNVFALQADSEILKQTLDLLEKRGFEWVGDHSARLTAEFQKTKRLRLRWLEDTAEPALREAQRVQPQQIQQSASTWIDLPKPLQISDISGRELVSNSVELEAEINLIKKML